jgi:hypothetical protein
LLRKTSAPHKIYADLKIVAEKLWQWRVEKRRVKNIKIKRSERKNK